MWVERKPVEGETVKVTFADFTNLGTKIGVYHGAYTEFGDCRRYLDSMTSFFVFEK